MKSMTKGEVKEKVADHSARKEQEQQKDPFSRRWRYTEQERARMLADPEAYFREERATPSFQAAERLGKYLQDAHLDPVILQSPEHVKLVWLMRELLQASHHSQALEWILKPIVTIMAQIDGRDGGRPTNAARYARWAARHAELKKTRRTLTAQELFEEIAQEESARTGTEVRWRTVKGGISKHNTATNQKGVSRPKG